ncbi:hypothetical protein [Streptomyces wuyuanensis]|uniref:hypothetical protein n=1 Tax=Streptomyces wuyuanensis TaxID=1196353 RepID=UPI003423FE46
MEASHAEIKAEITEVSPNPSTGECQLGANWLIYGEVTGCVVQCTRTTEQVWNSGAQEWNVTENEYWRAWRVEGDQVISNVNPHDYWWRVGDDSAAGAFEVSADVYWVDSATPEEIGFVNEGEEWVSLQAPNSGLLGDPVLKRAYEWCWGSGEGFKKKIHDENRYDVTSGQSRRARQWAVSENLRHTTFYHGTDLAAAKAIEEQGFRLGVKEGINAQGEGIYLTKNLQDAWNWSAGAVVVAKYIGQKDIVKVLVRSEFGGDDIYVVTSSKTTCDTLPADADQKQLTNFAAENGFGGVYMLRADRQWLVVVNPEDVQVVEVLKKEETSSRERHANLEDDDLAALIAEVKAREKAKMEAKAREKERKRNEQYYSDSDSDNGGGIF